MKPAPIPADENERLRELHAHEILDTEADPRFDAIAKLVATILEVPIALISLVDRDRQWFKARHGLAATETPRDVSFCGHVVAGTSPLVVRDAYADDRFADNPLVKGDPRVRFYAGYPLRTVAGHVLGTLCALDHAPRELSTSQQEALELLAQQVSALLELRMTEIRLSRERALGLDREARLADRERLLSTVFEGMVEGVVLQDSSGAILHHNAAAESILGLTAEELTGRTSVDPRWRATRADGSEFPGTEHPSMVTLRTVELQSNVEMCIQTPDGERRWLTINSRPLRKTGEVAPYAAIATFRDITENRLLAEKLSRHQRLVTTGTLAAGVGHEINNPLTYTLANLSMAIEELEDIAGGSSSQRLREIIGLLDEARQGGERVKRIVRGLKSLAREETEAQPVDVNAIVRSALQMANHELRTRATVELDLGESPHVLADESRLAQVLINLLVNAAQAFVASDPSRNQIVVRTRAADSVVIEVSDNGPGIDPQVLPRIFDPFFTTKGVGVGTGLGLAISHGIISALSGEIVCESTVGHGTTFRITLPPAAGVVETERRTSEARPLGRGRLLVVDDEPAILKAVTRMFRDELEVVAVGDPREALQRIRDGEHFDVVFSDLSMPYLSGVELYEAVAATHPAVAQRFVFISGDMSRHDLRAFLARVPNERFEKPFSTADLRAIVRRFLRTAV